MPAGFNHRVNIIHYDYLPDDEVGGSVPTGTTIGYGVNCRIESIPSTVVLLEQGVEVQQMFRVYLSGYGKDLSEYDEILVVHPPQSQYINKVFRVLASSDPSMVTGKTRGGKILIVTRREDSRSVQS